MCEIHGPTTQIATIQKPKPFVLPEYCKGCGRCIGACPKHCIDYAEILLVACNTPSQMCKRAVRALRKHGIRAGLLRPITLWPFPIDKTLPAVRRCRRIIVVEASYGQLEAELRLALSYATRDPLPAIECIRHYGGILPQQQEIVAYVEAGEEARR